MAIVDVNGEEFKKVLPKVVDIEPFGSMVLVEHLNADEVLGTQLFVKEDADVGTPQAYIVKFGSKVPADVGLAVGDRVQLQGSYVPVVNFNGHHRKRGLVEIHNIKAILKEGHPAE